MQVKIKFVFYSKITDISLYLYIMPIMDSLIMFELDLLNSSVNTTSDLQFLFLFGFIFIIIITYFVFWLPKINRMSVEVLFFILNFKKCTKIKINRTIKMLNMIPIKVIRENKNIRNFIKSLI